MRLIKTKMALSDVDNKISLNDKTFQCDTNVEKLVQVSRYFSGANLYFCAKSNHMLTIY